MTVAAGPVRTPYHPPSGDVPTVFDDETLLVADKPAGLLTVPGRGPEKADCLVSRLSESIPDVRIVHRLDMETSGLVLLAKSAEAQRRLSHLFEARQVTKTYTALIGGDLNGEAGTIDLPLSADWPNRPRQKVDHQAGKPAVTHWRVLARDRGCCRVELSPVTGRTHQLRVHLVALGHPIIGDTLYNGVPAPRLMLHATQLSLTHPVTEEPITFTSKPSF